MSHPQGELAGNVQILVLAKTELPPCPGCESWEDTALTLARLSYVQSLASALSNLFEAISERQLQ